MSTIKGELFVDYNGNLEKTHLVTEAELIEGFEDNNIGCRFKDLLR